MSWDAILYMSILGVACTMGLVTMATVIGLRYRRELPKLPILRSIEALEEERRTLEGQLADLQEDLRDARKTVEEGQRLQEWLDEKEDEIRRKREELGTLDEQYAKLEKVRQELAEAEASLEKVTAELRDQEEVVKEIAAAREALQECRNDLERLSREREDLAKEAAGLRETVEDLGKAREDLECTVLPLREELQELRTEKVELTGTVEALRKDQERLLQAVQGLREAHRAAGGVPEGHDPCAELYVPYIQERREAGGPADEVERLDRMERQLERVGIHLTRRTLRAFHTALKVQDMSPLTVLAGISGTGKSLLPAVYARCMGVHFLNLPVQPAWNAPQDLFGFYNYLEHKYKATPLARALLQFMCYERPEPVRPVLEDQMLLVLLDEMNLARIEYYFSELLSRLELRRTIDPGSEQERRKVAIPLEIPRLDGAGMDGASELRIYPGGNVLFTGTMNEDESTLSLSEKVLDRATVLRFGRPRRVVSVQPRLAGIPESPPLGYDVWRSWQARSDDDLPADIKELIHDTLAGILADLGMPLAHRTAQGIHQYLALYPGGDKQRFRHALADQVEQRVLPRARGRDNRLIEAPMRRLARLLEKELEDTELARAIETALRDEQGVFLWAGLDRTDA